MRRFAKDGQIITSTIGKEHIICCEMNTTTTKGSRRIAFSRSGGIDTYPDAKTPQNAEKQPERNECSCPFGPHWKGCGKTMRVGKHRKDTMTKQECAVVMAYTGVTMLTGADFDIFHQYVERIMNRPVWTHELADERITAEIKKRSEPDFIELCRTAT